MVKLKLMNIDDDLDIISIVRFALENDDIEVISCSSSAEALALLPKVKPDLLLLDVMMPQMDGLTFLRTVHEDKNLPNIPTIFMTAKTSRESIEEYQAIGAIGVIPKPFDPLTLGQQIREFYKNA